MAKKKTMQNGAKLAPDAKAKIDDEINKDGYPVKKGFMCQTDFDWHLEDDPRPVSVHSSMKALKKSVKCWDSCGVYEVAITVKKVVVKQDLMKGALTPQEPEAQEKTKPEKGEA